MAIVDPSPLLVSEKSAAKALGVSVRTMYAMRKAGRIAFVKIAASGRSGAGIRYSVADLQNFISANRHQHAA